MQRNGRRIVRTGLLLLLIMITVMMVKPQVCLAVNKKGEIRAITIHKAEDMNSFFDKSVVTVEQPIKPVVQYCDTDKFGVLTFPPMKIKEVVSITDSNGTRSITSETAIPAIKGRIGGNPSNGFEGYFYPIAKQTILPSGATREKKLHIYMKYSRPLADPRSNISLQLGKDEFFPNFSHYKIEYQTEIKDLGPCVAPPAPPSAPQPSISPSPSGSPSSGR